ncbi:MFS transporter [Lacihabitans sp. LS3-19]|uniref:MFS transporter n=1 Tax=Lacihabitans sp. LS3-19 TaxID=2487335 RepID=UPI0020CE5C4B|nr:MFS transporter [Lacihabitans sp. LS3-19]MCP9767165.1 MFS transporter [Lacihabitans sp. LS3-19]
MLKNRIAISSYFFVNGFLYANLMARLPLLQQNLNISNSLLGTLLFMVAIGSLATMPFTGWLSTRIGTHAIARNTGLLFCIVLPFITLVPNVILAAVAMFFIGSFMGSMDVSMNGQAVYVERLWGKPIITSFHAVFSIGMALGAAAGSLFSYYTVPLFQHILSVSFFCMVLVYSASFFLINDKESNVAQQNEEGGSSFRWPTKAIVPLGLIAFCCMIGEGSMTDWTAIYMTKVVGENATFAALAFGLYATGMTIGRLFGDRLAQYFGYRKLLIYDALLSFSGLLIALVYVSVPTTLLGFFVVGLGVASIVPIIFSLAGNTPGVNPAVGIAMATTIGYTGFFVGPPSIGYISDAAGLRLGLGFSLLLFSLMLVLIFKYIEVKKP